jgi:ribosomal protein S18 acetylase RimI-like enzyme
VNLQVYVPNEPAITLYKAIGFVEYGIESEAVCLDGQYHDGVHMTLVKSRHNKPLHPTAYDIDQAQRYASTRSLRSIR